MQDDDFWANILASTQTVIGGLSLEQSVDEIIKAGEDHETDAQLTLDLARRICAVNHLSPRSLGLMPGNYIHCKTHAPAFAADLGLDKKDSVMATYMIQVIEFSQWLFHSDREPPLVTLSPLRGSGRSVSGGRVSKGKAVRISGAGAQYTWPLPFRRIQYTETTSGTAAVSTLHGAPAGVMLAMSSVGRAAPAAQSAGATVAAAAPTTSGNQDVPAYLTQLNDGTTIHCAGQASDEPAVEVRTPPLLDDVEKSFLTTAVAHEAAAYPSYHALTQWEDRTNRGKWAVSWRQQCGLKSGPADGSPTGCAGLGENVAPTAVRCTVWFRRLVVADAWMLATKRLGTWPSDFMSTAMATASVLRVNNYLLPSVETMHNDLGYFRHLFDVGASTDKHSAFTKIAGFFMQLGGANGSLDRVLATALLMMRAERVATQIVFNTVAGKYEWRAQVVGFYWSNNTKVAAEVATKSDKKNSGIGHLSSRVWNSTRA